MYGYAHTYIEHAYIACDIWSITTALKLNTPVHILHVYTHKTTGLMKAYASSGISFAMVDSPLYEISLEQR